jgi:hypothetical protein
MVGPGTRRFALPRVRSDFDFDGLRGFDTSLQVRIPGPFPYTGRDAIHQSRRFELWSPNSSKMPVCPGTMLAGFSLAPPLAYRRTDGSSDWTLAPQHLDTNFLHHPFITDPERATGNKPEFMYLTAVWNSLAGSYIGRLQLGFCASLRNRAAQLEQMRLTVFSILPPHLGHLTRLISDAPTPFDLDQFGNDMDWETCIDGLGGGEGWLVTDGAGVLLLEKFCPCSS